LNGSWTEPPVRDEVIDTVRTWADKTEIHAKRLVDWVGIDRSKYYQWKQRYGKVNEHNAWIPRDHWLDDWEKQAIIAYQQAHPLEGYRRLTYMMIDEDVVAVSPASVYRVLKKAGLLARWNGKPSKKGTGFVQPLKPHEHWHTDVSYLNLGGTFYHLCSVLDGFSRYIIHWEIREAMTAREVEIILQRAKELFPEARPRIISDNGPQFIGREFKEFLRISGMTHVRTSPYYPQSNGKIERWHQSLKAEGIRPYSPLSLDDARRIVGRYVRDYNERRLHGGIDYLTPRDKLEGRAEQILAERDRKLAVAREGRKYKRAALTTGGQPIRMIATGETEAGVAGTRPARDNPLELRRHVERAAVEPDRGPLSDMPEMFLMPSYPDGAPPRRPSLSEELEVSNSR
jgi:transposase InsO family protein